MLEKWPWDRFFSEYFCFCPVIVIPPMLHTHQFICHWYNIILAVESFI
jgi:hypothetical protein